MPNTYDVNTSGSVVTRIPKIYDATVAGVTTPIKTAYDATVAGAMALVYQSDLYIIGGNAVASNLTTASGWTLGGDASSKLISTAKVQFQTTTNAGLAFIYSEFPLPTGFNRVRITYYMEMPGTGTLMYGTTKNPGTVAGTVTTGQAQVVLSINTTSAYYLRMQGQPGQSSPRYIEIREIYLYSV